MTTLWQGTTDSGISVQSIIEVPDAFCHCEGNWKPQVKCPPGKILPGPEHRWRLRALTYRIRRGPSAPGQFSSQMASIAGTLCHRGFKRKIFGSSAVAEFGIGVLCDCCCPMPGVTETGFKVFDPVQTP